MPKNLNYGYQLLESTDDNTTILETLQNNIQRLSVHTHDGSDSAVLPQRTALIQRNTGWSSIIWSENRNTDGLYEGIHTVGSPNIEFENFSFFTGTVANNKASNMEELILEYTVDVNAKRITLYTNTKFADIMIKYG